MVSGDRPRLRTDLSLVARGGVARPSYLLSDPAGGRVLNLGEVERFLCAQMDGSATTGEILARYAAAFGAPLDPAHLEAFLRQLDDAGLLVGGSATRRSTTFAELLDAEHFLVVGHVRLMGGDRLLGFVARHVGWAFSRVAHAVAASLVLFALYLVCTGWTPYEHALLAHWGPAFFLLLIFPGSLVVRSVRVLTAGVLCKRYRRQVPEIGIAFLYYLIPWIYCDWSDALWIRDKAKRLWILFSSLYAQGLIWAIATVGWWATRDGSFLNTVSLGLSAAAALSLLLLTANPLVQMEGYLILADWLEQLNLRMRALAAFGSWVTGRPDPEPMSRARKFALVLYGGLSFLYGVAMVGLHLFLAWIWLTGAFEGAGALATLAIALFMLQKPILEGLGRLSAWRWLVARRAGPLQWTARAALLLGLVACGFVPCDYETGGPFTFLPERQVEVRSQLDGMVEKVFVTEGQEVEAGEPLARLYQREPETSLKVARARLQETEATLKLLRAGAREEAIHRAATAVSAAEAKLAWSEPRAERYSGLFTQNAIGRQDYENAMWTRDLDRSELGEARAQLQLVQSGARSQQIDALEARRARYRVMIADYEEQLAVSVLTSPVDGQVVTPRVEETEGRYLEAGDLLAVVAASRRLRAEIEVPEASLADVRIGATVRLAAWAYPDTTFTGRVVSIAPVALPHDDGPVVRVTTDVPNTDHLLKADMTGFAKIAVGRRPLWRVLLWRPLRWLQVQVWGWLP
jgi:multidrug resistance efflux pump